jgi:ABC-2 type transport system permease protein
MFMAPGMVVVSLIFPVELPTDLGRWALFFVMIWFSFLINSQLNLIVGLFAFFVENNEGMIRMKRVAIDLLSGVLVPMSFFPLWAQNVLGWTPFPAITYLPSSVFTGRISGTEALEALLVQAIWAVVLIIPIFFMWRASRRRLFVQGG